MVDQGNVTPSGQQVPSPVVRPAPVARPLPVNDSEFSQPSQAVPVAAKAAEQKPVSAEQAKSAAAALNRRAEFRKFKVHVTVDEGSDKVIVQILSRDSGEVVQQLPPEGILQLAEKLHVAGVSGILLDEQI